MLAGFLHLLSLLIRVLPNILLYTGSEKQQEVLLGIAPFGSFLCGQVCQSASLRAFAWDTTEKHEKQWRGVN